MVRTMVGFGARLEGASPAASRSGKPRGEFGGELVRLVSIDTTRTTRSVIDEARLDAYSRPHIYIFENLGQPFSLSLWTARGGCLPLRGLNHPAARAHVTHAEYIPTTCPLGWREDAARVTCTSAYDELRVASPHSCNANCLRYYRKAQRGAENASFGTDTPVGPPARDARVWSALTRARLAPVGRMQHGRATVVLLGVPSRARGTILASADQLRRCGQRPRRSCSACYGWTLPR